MSKNGVSWYDTGQVTVSVNFPEGDRRCKWCQFCRTDNGIRQKCTLTNYILFSIDYIPTSCPLKFEEEHKE